MKTQKIRVPFGSTAEVFYASGSMYCFAVSMEIVHVFQKKEKEIERNSRKTWQLLQSELEDKAREEYSTIQCGSALTGIRGILTP